MEEVKKDEIMGIWALVTGASGLIGRHVLHALLLKGYEVTATYNSSSPPFFHPRLTWLQKDLMTDSLLRISQNSSFTHLVHCAAAIPSAKRNDHECYVINKAIDKNVLGFCNLNNNLNIVYISSVYIQDYLATKKGSESTYYQAKIEGEQEISFLRNNSCIMRVSSPYGIGQSTRNVLQIFMERVVKGEDITFFGKGSRTQDFISAADVAGAALKYLGSNIGKCTLNVCSSSPVSMKELAYLVKAAYPDTASKVIQSDAEDPQEDYRAIFDNTQALELINWRPTISLPDGIKECVNFLSKIG